MIKSFLLALQGMIKDSILLNSANIIQNGIYIVHERSSKGEVFGAIKSDFKILVAHNSLVGDSSSALESAEGIVQEVIAKSVLEGFSTAKLDFVDMQLKINEGLFIYEISLTITSRGVL